MQWPQCQLELPAAARKSELSLSHFPLQRKAGAGGFPPRRWHAARQQNAPARTGASALPATGVSMRSAQTPRATPPEKDAPGTASRWSVDLQDRAGQRIKHGRHVGLDFYDLLIEAYYNARGSPLKKKSALFQFYVISMSPYVERTLQ